MTASTALQFPPPASFEEFYEHWHSHIRQYVISRGYQAPELNDVVQEVFLHLWKRWGKINQELFHVFVWSHVHFVVQDHRKMAARLAKRESRPRVVEVPWTASRERRDQEQLNDSGGSAETESLGLATRESGFSVVECNQTLAATRRTLRRAGTRPLRLFDEMVAAVVADTNGTDADLARRTGRTRQRTARDRQTLVNLAEVRALRNDLLVS